MEKPVFDSKKGWPVYWMEVGKYLNELNKPKKEACLVYLNGWLNLRGNDKLKSLTFFNKKYVDHLPNNTVSKKFLIDNFNHYNELFKLELEYNEELFTKYNVLYMLKLMLKQIDFDLKREKTPSYKRYSIICLKEIPCFS